MPINHPNRRHHRGRARAKHLQQAPARARLRHLAHREAALADGPPLGGQAVARQREDRIPRHALQDGAVQRGGDQLARAVGVAKRGEEIHHADLGDEFLAAARGRLVAEEPEVLREALRGGLHLRDDAGRVVGAEFFVAHAAGPGAHGAAGGLQADGFEAGGVVGPHGAGDEVEEGGTGGPDAKGALGRYEGGAEVEGEALRVGYVPVFQGAETLEELSPLLFVEARQGDALRGPVQTRHVHIGTEEA